MSKSLFHATEKFDTTIYCLVSRQDSFFLPISVGKLKKNVGHGIHRRLRPSPPAEDGQ